MQMQEPYDMFYRSAHSAAASGQMPYGENAPYAFYRLPYMRLIPPPTPAQGLGNVPTLDPTGARGQQYDFFHREAYAPPEYHKHPTEAYVPGWKRESNFGNVERVPPRTGPNYPHGTQTPIMNMPPLLVANPHVGDVPSERKISEHGEDFSMFFRGAIGTPRYLSKQGETYDFLY
jgi:hypothetical protein